MAQSCAWSTFVFVQGVSAAAKYSNGPAMVDSDLVAVETKRPCVRMQPRWDGGPVSGQKSWVEIIIAVVPCALASAAPIGPRAGRVANTQPHHPPGAASSGQQSLYSISDACDRRTHAIESTVEALKSPLAPMMAISAQSWERKAPGDPGLNPMVWDAWQDPEDEV